MNALKHGLTAEQIVLPNEDPEEYDALCQQWLDDYPDADAAQLALIEIAVRNTWKLRRADDHERAMSAHRMRHAADAFDCQERVRAEEIGRRLLHDPINRCAIVQKDDRTLDMLDDWFKNDDPPVLMQQLTTSAPGVDWALRQWGELGGLIERTRWWHYNDKFRAIRLMGKRPQDVLDDDMIGKVFAICHHAHPDPLSLWDECHQARMGTEGKPMYIGRVDALEKWKFADKQEAVNDLKDIVAREIKKLQERKEELDPIHARDRAEAADRAALEDTPGSAVLHRYKATYQRSLQRSVAELIKIRKPAAKAAGEPRVRPS
jgi:hypothetical protein